MLLLRVIQVIKVSIKIAVFWAAFFSFHLSAHTLTLWIPPVDDGTKSFFIGSVEYTDSAQWCGEREEAINPVQTPDATNFDCFVDRQGELEEWWNFKYDYGLDGALHGSAAAFVTILKDEEKTCKNPDWPKSEDVDGDGVIDHCHKSECRKNMPIFTLPPHFSRSNLCVGDGAGEYCQYKPGSIQTSDGRGFVIFSSTSNSCGTDASALPHEEYSPTPDDNLPDPSDPNNPPDDAGNTECTPLPGTSLTVCTVDPNTECTNGVCPPSCGELNGEFVCIREDDGTTPSVDEVANDNTDHQGADDESTAGDEGTHSRLDGLLENTDGIEGLLLDLIGAVDGIENGEGEGTGEECAPGEFLIAETCVKFDKNDQPVNIDLDYFEIDKDIEKAKSDIRIEFDSIQASLTSKFSLSLVGGGYTPNTQVIKGVSVDFGIARLDSLFNFSYFGALIFFIASIRALFILLGR